MYATFDSSYGKPPSRKSSKSLGRDLSIFGGVPDWLKDIAGSISLSPLQNNLIGMSGDPSLWANGNSSPGNFNGNPLEFLQSLMGKGAPPHIPGTVFEREKPKEEQPGLSPIQLALAQLDQLMNQGGASSYSEQDLNAALQEAAAGIRKQYGAQIGGLRAANQGAKQDVNEGSAKVRQMYNALARSYAQAGKKEMKQGKSLAHNLQQMSNQSQNQLTQQGEQLNESSAAAAKGLGLADLGAELIGKNNEAVQGVTKDIQSRGNMAVNTALGQAGNNRTYMNTQGTTSRLEGTNKAADMYAQLQDYLQANRSQMASIAGARAAALAAAKSGITSDFSQAQSDSQQDLIDNKLKLLQMAMDAQKTEFDQSHWQPKGGNNAEQNFYDMLPKQLSGPQRILDALGSPQVNKLYGELSDSSGMQTGYANFDGRPGGPLQDNYANIKRYVEQMVDPSIWRKLGPGQQQALIAALMQQLHGSSTEAALP